MNAAQSLVTTALPYANGPLHLGHILEYIQADVWVRSRRMAGQHCVFVCADDAHGTPIMLRAEAEGISTEDLIERIGREHQADCADFSIGFDNFYTTHSTENREFAEQIYRRLREKGHIEQRVITQAYDPERDMFLPDRYVKGECPNCATPDQNGDNCDACGATYTPLELKNPRSVLSGAVPVERESLQYFFKVGDFTEMLRQWVRSGAVQPEIANKLDEWFAAGLQPWDIARNAPYWGFEIPDAPGKFFYVWLDAPIGYMASAKNLFDRTGEDFATYWAPESSSEVHHFIGKDIARFHTLFWPAMLKGADYRLPTAVHCHGFLTVDGQKMSKSKGTFINARTYLDHLDADYLRYYLTSKISSGIDDLDLNLEDFRQRVNSDLVGKLVNIASRCAGFIAKRFDAKLSERVINQALYQEFKGAGDEVIDAYEKLEFSRAIRIIMALADKANRYIDEQKPWEAIKQPDQQSAVHEVCSLGINLYRALVILLKPVVPTLASASEAFLNVEPLRYADLATPLSRHAIKRFKPLMTRIEASQIAAMVDASVEQPATATKPAAVAATPTVESLEEQISIEQFNAVDLRIARIIAADPVAGADKLLQLTLDIGEQTPRTVFAGIKAHYSPEQLVGRLTVMVANLAPRTMRFGVSEGMVLAAGDAKSGLHLLEPDNGAAPGMRAR